MNRTFTAGQKDKNNNKGLKCVRVKSPYNFLCGIKAFATDFFLAFQLALLAALYAILAYEIKIFFFVSLALTALSAVHAFVTVKDSQCKAGWLILFLFSFGCGYIIYLLANKRVLFGADKKTFKSLYERSAAFVGAYSAPNSSRTVQNDCDYLYNSGGFKAYENTRINYFSSGSDLFEDILSRLALAEKFIFIESFIVSEGELLERLIEVLKCKTAEGVEVRFLYDDAGSQGTLTSATKKRMREAGIKLRTFSKMFTLFSFGLNFRDHRKIVVVDGKTAYTGGSNIADECINAVKSNGYWKDSGVRLDGGAVDAMSLIFLRQWEYVCKTGEDWGGYLGRYEEYGGYGAVVPYAGGPDLSENVCRGVYANAINGATEQLYIMTPYFIPDGEISERIRQKAFSGVDVRLVLPAVPDYKFIYRVSVSNAERLMDSGVKVYFAENTFVHAKVMLTENCAVTGSVNMDMRSFYQEFDNGVYTDDCGVMEQIAEDFARVINSQPPAEKRKRSISDRFVTALLKVVSPLM